MRQWQPHRTNLLPSWRDAVEDSSRDDEVASSIVVAQRQPEVVVVEGDCRANDAGHGGDRPRESALARRYNHALIVWADSSIEFRRSRLLLARQVSSWSPSSIRPFSRSRKLPTCW